MSENFWPANLLDQLPTRTPLTVLTEQAAGLTTLTGRVLEGVVQTTPDGERLVHQFLIHAPVLGIRVPLLRVTSGPGGPPLSVDGKYVRTPRICQSLEELSGLLREVFGADEVVQVVRRMVADSRAKGLPYFLVEDEEWVGSAPTREEAQERALRRVRPDDIIDIYELATGRKIGTVGWVGKETPEVKWYPQQEGTTPSPAAKPPVE